MRNKFVTALLGLVVSAGILAGCGTAKTADNKAAAAPQAAKSDKIKVAFVYVGPVGDGGYTFAHDQGRKYMEQQLGDKVEDTFIENVPEGADGTKVFEQLAQKGYKIIFGTSFGYMDSMVEVAKKFPNTIFMHASGYKTAPNMGTYFGRNYQGFYEAGIVAGLQTKNNNIGMVAAYPIPEVIRAINALTLGARSVNPNAKVKVLWTNTWFDPAKEKDAANSLLDAGADLITMYQDSPGPLQAAQEHGKTAIGNDSDSRQYAPNAFLTAPVWNWGPYYVSVVKSVMDGTWKSDQYFGGMKDGIVALAPLAKFANPAAQAKVDEAKAKLTSGTWDVFTGPIKDQKGQVKVEAGKSLDDQALLSMNWFVEGVDGTIPQN
ncbi:MAG: BMP family ABC transporter substrate-binding protein [Mycobacterium leprae]